MATINGQAEQAERDKLLKELKAQRAVKAAELAKLDEKLEAVSDADFKARLGDRRRSEMSTRERAEVIRKIGSERYLQLDW